MLREFHWVTIHQASTSGIDAQLERCSKASSPLIKLLQFSDPVSKCGLEELVRRADDDDVGMKREITVMIKGTRPLT